MNDVALLYCSAVFGRVSEYVTVYVKLLEK